MKAAVAWLGLGLAIVAGGPALARLNTVVVQVRYPVDAKLETEGIRRILVGGFLSNDYGYFDVEGEIVKILRGDLEKVADFLILEDPPIALPEQRLEDLKENGPFFQTMAGEYRADIIVSGQILYNSADQSGFSQEEFISPVTGRRSIRTSWVERIGFNLRLDLIFMRGSDGELLYDVSFFQDEVFRGDTADSLSVFYELVERFREGYLGILTPRERIESRYLFTE